MSSDPGKRPGRAPLPTPARRPAESSNGRRRRVPKFDYFYHSRLAADRKAALEHFSADSNEQTAATFLECDARCRAHEQGLREAHTCGHRSVAARCFHRTQAPLKSALTAAMAEIKSEIERVVEADEAAARTLGLTADDCRSPIRHRLAMELSHAQKNLEECHVASELGHLKNGLRFLEK